jgi:GTPase SAR1 family protein
MSNFLLVGPRGWGKSYIISNLVGYEFLFDGIIDYDDYLEHQRMRAAGKKIKPTRTNTIVSAADSKYTDATISKTKLTLDNLPGSLEVDGKFFPSPLSKQYEGSFSRQITAKYRQKIGGNWQEKGSGSTIKNRTFKDNPYAVQGERSKLQVWDEIGFFNNLRPAYAASVDTQIVSGRKVGSSFFTGTGGDLGGTGGVDAQYMFYHPTEFDLLVFQDEYENQGKIATFLPAWFTNEEFKDNNGWLADAEEAKEHYRKERKRLIESGGDSLTLDNFIVYHPVVPSEVFLSKKGAYLPTVELQNRLVKVRGEHIEETLAKRVELFFEPSSTYGVDYRVDTEGKLQPINEFP